MATSEEKVGGPATDDGFTSAEAVFVDGDMLGPESDDPVQSRPEPEFITSKELKKEQDEESQKESGNGKKEGGNNLKSTFIISGVVVAVIGAIFAIARKIKEA